MDQRRLIILSIIGTGISSVTTQLITIREFLTQFHGNEITISLVLFCWLWLTGMGSLAAKWIKRPSLSAYCLLVLGIALWPLLQLVGVRALRGAFFAHGVSPGFYSILLYIFICILPYCLLTGFVLPYSQKLLNTPRHDFKSGELYFYDGIGDVLGGALFSFILVFLLSPFAAIAVSSTALILISLLLLLEFRRYVFLSIALIPAIFFYHYTLNADFEKATLIDQYGQIIQYLESPFGRIVISKEGEQYTLWESGTPLYSGANVIKSEEKIHYSLCHLDQVKDVLLISGGLGKTLEEVVKYHPNRVDYVELDPMMTNAALDFHIIEETPKLNIINTDGRLYLKETRRQYDSIIVDLPDPDTYQINRFFTSDFFALVKQRLNPGGVFSISIQYSPNYISDILNHKLSIIYNTLKRHFKNVLILPGEEAYFLCRDGNLWTDIPSRLEQKAVSTSYVTGFFHGNVTEERIMEINQVMDPHMLPNLDFEPRLVNIVFQEWFIKYDASPTAFLVVLSLLVLFYLLMIKKEEFILFSTGFATMGIEMLIIFAFQVIYGYIYLQIGAIITAFLLGLLPGVMMGKKGGGKPGRKLMVSELLFLVLLVLFYVWAEYDRRVFPPVIFLLYGFLFSFACGFQFPIVTAIMGEEKSPAAGCLAADLAGAAVGTFIVGTLLIPILGVKAAMAAVILVKILSSLVSAAIK